MSAVAVFNYSDWLKRYPELANTLEPQAFVLFAEAELYLNNTGFGGKVRDATAQTQLLYMITAHIAYLSNGDLTGSAPGAGVVGHIDQASQGSVSVAASVASNVPLTAAFWLQTRYGLAFWQGTAQYRTARFRGSYRTPLVGGARGGRPFI